jgi:hypothetical protein
MDKPQMSEEFKEKIGAEAYIKLQELLKREANIMNLGKIDAQVKIEAIRMLQAWIGSIYDLTIKPEQYDPDMDLDNLFKITN